MEESKIEKFLVEGKLYETLSDHFGVSTVLKVQQAELWDSNVKQIINLRRLSKFVLYVTQQRESVFQGLISPLWINKL